MSVQIRRGTEAERAAMSASDPEAGELLYITDTDGVYVGDGVTAGGIEVGGGGEINTASSAGSGTNLFFQKSTYDLQFNAIKSENTKLGVALDGVTHDIELTINEGNIVHDNLSGGHNLSTDIDHNGLTNTHNLTTDIANNSAVALNTDKLTNVTTNLSEGTSTTTTVDVDSSDGTNATLVSASTLRAGLLTAAKWDEIVVNNGKATNVSTNLSEGTSTTTTVDVDSSDGTNATLVSASTTRAGLLTAAKWDEIVVNTGKNTNVSTDLSEGTATVTTVDVNSSDGNNATLVSASTSRAGLLTKAKFDEIVANTSHISLTNNPHAVDTADLSLTEALQVQMELTPNDEIQYVAPFSMTITGWTMLLDVSGSAAIDVWKDTYANHPPVVGDSIVTPSVTTAAKNQATGLSIAVTAGDCLIFHVDSVTTATLATLALTGVRT